MLEMFFFASLHYFTFLSILSDILKYMELKQKFSGELELFTSFAYKQSKLKIYLFYKKIAFFLTFMTQSNKFRLVLSTSS